MAPDPPRRTPRHNAAGALAAGLICAGLAAMGLYVALGGGSLQGGIPFVPAGWNQAMGRVVMGLGALVTAALAVWAFADAARILRR